MAYIKGKTIWFTGLPCSGKTTLANALNKKIFAERLDGDEMRKILSKGLGFTKEDREEHLRRMAYVAGLLNRNGVNVIAAFITPYENIRREIKDIIENMGGEFILVYTKCSLETCMKRDVKGMYKKALKGEIKNFTGVDDPFEEPENPDIIINTEEESVEEGVRKILKYLDEHKKTYSVFIGRYQPLHKGHKKLIEQALERNENVLVAIRDTKLSNKNPLTVKERMEIIKEVFGDKVDVVVIPDVNKVYIGRDVGYEVIKLPKEFEEISATKVRSGEYEHLPEKVREYIERNDIKLKVDDE